MYILGIIPARKNSKGIPHKNWVPLCNKPLIEYTIQAAKASMLDDWVITTDDEETAKGGHVLRPPELARDDTPMLPVAQHVISAYENGQRIDAVMILQPTSPLRTAEDINQSIIRFLEPDYYRDGKEQYLDSLVSVTYGIHPIKSYDLQEGCIPTPFVKQKPYDKYQHRCYTRNGAIFITRRDLLDSGGLIGDNPGFYVMPKGRSVDVDDYEDLMIAEALLKYGRGLH